MNEARTLIPACDVEDLDALGRVVEATASISRVGGYKIGAEIVIRYGLIEAVRKIRHFSEKPIIYDHQKAGTDIPDTGAAFAQACKDCGVDSVILFPQSGPVTETEWIRSLQAASLTPMIGGEMTHRSYAESEGGYIRDSAIDQMYGLAAEQGVSDFVVPGNRVESVLRISNLLRQKVVGREVALYAPGFIAQGGELSAAAAVAGTRWHAIIGRALLNPDGLPGIRVSDVDTIRDAAKRLVSQIP